MEKHYAVSILLLEFKGDREVDPVTICRGFNDVEESSAKSIITKFVLLLGRFPKLRIVWSKSPQHTAELFKAIKSGRDDPDVALASELGSNEQVSKKPSDTYRSHSSKITPPSPPRLAHSSIRNC